MTESIARLGRLHALRSRLADAAAADREQIRQRIRATEHALRELDRDRDSALHLSPKDGVTIWRERAAAWSVAAVQRENLSHRRAQSIEAEKAAAARERVALQEREQVGRILEQKQREAAAAHERREQARLDEMFATARTRSAMTTAF